MPLRDLNIQGEWIAHILFNNNFLRGNCKQKSWGPWGERQNQAVESNISKPLRQFRPQLGHIYCNSDSSWHLCKVKDSGKQIYSPLHPGIIRTIYSCGKMELFFFIIAAGVWESLWKTPGPLWRGYTSISYKVTEEKATQVSHHHVLTPPSTESVVCPQRQCACVYMPSYISITLRLGQCHPQGAWKLGFNVSWEAHSRQK